MEEIYNKIWQIAKPYYEKGRPMDVEHIEWMMQDAEKVCENENIDKTLLMPLVILHDIGYALINHKENDSYKVDLRKAHMQAGAELAKEILNGIHYDPSKIDKITYYISVHDNWALGDDEVFKDPLLGTFQDLDFMWMISPKGFRAAVGMYKKTPKEIIDYYKNNEKLIKRPLATKTTKELFYKYIEERKKEL
jgi:hypothetical protein